MSWLLREGGKGLAKHIRFGLDLPEFRTGIGEKVGQVALATNSRSAMAVASMRLRKLSRASSR